MPIRRYEGGVRTSVRWFNPHTVAANWCSPVAFSVQWTGLRSEGGGECQFAATGEEWCSPVTFPVPWIGRGSDGGGECQFAAAKSDQGDTAGSLRHTQSPIGVSLRFRPAGSATPPSSFKFSATE